MNSEVDVNIIGTGKVKFGLEYRDLLSDQGVCINVFGEVEGEEQQHSDRGPSAARDEVVEPEEGETQDRGRQDQNKEQRIDGE